MIRMHCRKFSALFLEGGPQELTSYFLLGFSVLNFSTVYKVSKDILQKILLSKKLL